MKKIISFVGLFAVLGVGIGDAHGVAMSAQVRRLLQEKQEKIEQLEKCEGKKQGWMIAGISTIGLTAVGVGVNIAQASKGNRLSDEIEMEKSTLERHQNELNRIQNDIATERAKQAKSGVGNGQGGSSVSTPAGGEMIEPFCCTVVVDDSNVPMSDFIGIIGCDDDANTTSSTDASGQFCFNKSMLSTAKCFIGGWSEGIEYGVFDSSIGELKRHCVDGKQKIMLCNTDSVPVQKLGQDCSGGTADGVIGESCDDGKGVWFTAIEGNNKKCSNSAGEIVDCKCVETTYVTPKPVQGSGGGDKPVEKPKTSETNGRVVGGACIDEDIKKLSPYGWVSGTYIRVSEKANSTTVLKARCETKKGNGDNVPCNCKATACYESKGFDPTPDKNGLCVKKKAEQKPAAKPKENPTEKPAEEQQEKPKESPKQTTSDSLDASIDGEYLCYYDIDGDGKYTGECSVSNPGDWGVVFPDYTVYGTAVCNRNPGIPIGDMTNRGGTNCWCKMTYPKESRWVYIGNNGVAKNRKESCANSCSVACAADVKFKEHVRNKLFNSAK